MRETLRKLRDIRQENCITIIMTTHRTKPDYLKDSLHLKNLIKEAETRLMADLEKKQAEKLVEKLESLAANIDHGQNIESLFLFVNEDIAEYIRLPITVRDRVVIDDTFATRDLFRAIHLETHYYILVLSQEKVRLLEAMSNKLIREIGDPFPFENQFYIRSRAAASIASNQTNILAEFFNRADKRVNEERKKNPLPIFICGLDENQAAYMETADTKQSFLTRSLNKNKINSPAHEIVEEVWEVMKEKVIRKNNERKADLQRAVSENKFLSDTNEIWKAISEGRVQTLFVEQGLFQPAIINDGEIEYVSDDRRNEAGVIDDIYDEMIEANMDFNGDVVFLPKGELDKFNGFGAITRY